jgi:hypothetical protein
LRKTSDGVKVTLASRDVNLVENIVLFSYFSLKFGEMLYYSPNLVSYRTQQTSKTKNLIPEKTSTWLWNIIGILLKNKTFN